MKKYLFYLFAFALSCFLHFLFIYLLFSTQKESVIVENIEESIDVSLSPYVITEQALDLSASLKETVSLDKKSSVKQNEGSSGLTQKESSVDSNRVKLKKKEAFFQSDVKDEVFKDLIAHKLQNDIDQENDSAKIELEDIQPYIQKIIKKTSEYWVRPPIAKKGMSVTLKISLDAHGSVININIIKSSGLIVFDNSAKRAIRKASFFELPEKLSLKQKYFRELTFVFSPDDL